MAGEPQPLDVDGLSRLELVRDELARVFGADVVERPEIADALRVIAAALAEDVAVDTGERRLARITPSGALRAR